MNSKFLSPLILGVLLGISALTIDQTTKFIVLSNANTIANGIPVLPNFNIVLFYNTGVSFGMFNNFPWWLLIFIGLAICTLVSALLWNTKSRFEASGYGLIIGGALGNIIDRLNNGAVTDFLDFYYRDTHWPAFNFADVFIFMGASIIIIATYFEHKNERKR